MAASRPIWIWCAAIAFGAVVLVLGFIGMSLWQVRPGPEYHFPAPSGRLTEQIAIDLSKRALIRDGKGTAGMRPVLSQHKGEPESERFFCRTRDGSEDGWVLWWLEKPEYTWEYMVGIRRDGDEVVCSISSPK